MGTLDNPSFPPEHCCDLWPTEGISSISDDLFTKVTLLQELLLGLFDNL